MRSDTNYLYTYSWRPEELEFCQLEMRAFFGYDVSSNVLISAIEIEPSRSPFMRERLDVLFVADELSEIVAYVQEIDLQQSTYKIVCLNSVNLGSTHKITRNERQEIERMVGFPINGEPNLQHPDIIFGVVLFNNQWYFGKLIVGEAIWLKHQQKPQTYSTSLSTRVARAIVNIAIPNPKGVRAIDPCCGIGTVLVEALSMDIQIEGRDINPFVCVGSRKNIAHFELEGNVTLGPIAEVKEHYDVAIIDMPYNVFTHISEQSQQAIIKEAKRIADKAVIVTIDTIDEMLERAGFDIKDRCVVKKGSFLRQVLVCE